MKKNAVFKIVLLIVGIMGIYQWTLAQESTSNEHYLFSYFVGNGEDGLHLAHSTDGLQWQALNNGKSFLTPRVGDDKLMRDPSIVQGPDGTFHMVWTVSWGEKGIGYASSQDLIHWSEQQLIPVMEHEPEALNCWAPELYYDDSKKQFIIVWSTTIPGKFPKTDGQDGDKYNHRLYAVNTQDFSSFSDTKLFYDHGFNVIDGAIFKHEDRYAMLLKDETNKPFPVQKNIRLAFSSTATGPWSEPTKPITGDYWAEGPTTLQINGQWHVYFDKYVEDEYGVVVSEGLKEWKDYSEKLEVPQEMRHGTAFKVSGGVARKLFNYSKKDHD